jgi:hypothetical protein
MSDFVICIINDSNTASLILGKVYRRLPDAEAESHNMLRVRPSSVLCPLSAGPPRLSSPLIADG